MMGGSLGKLGFWVSGKGGGTPKTLKIHVSPFDRARNEKWRSQTHPEIVQNIGTSGIIKGRGEANGAPSIVILLA